MLNRYKTRGLILFSIFILIVSKSIVAASTSPVPPISNMQSGFLKQALFIGPVDPLELIHVTIWLKIKHKSQLDALVSQIYNPESANYQQFLSHKEYTKRFEPSLAIKNKIVNYFKQHGVHAEIVFSNIQVSATVKQIEDLFKIRLNQYHYHNKIVYANDRLATIPSEIAPFISDISGLDSVPRSKSRRHSAPKTASLIPKHWVPHLLQMAWRHFVPQALPSTTSLQGFSGSQLRTTYKLAQIERVNGTVIDGTGQTIVIVDGCDTATVNDIMNYSNHYNRLNNLPELNASNFSVVKHTGEPYQNHCNDPGDWNGEIMLDVQAAHTIAPGANIVLVLTDNVRNDQVAQAINYITRHNFQIGGFANAYILSNSWDNNYEEEHESLETILESASAQGMSINFAAGDCGDQTYNSSWTCSKLSDTPSVQYPVSSTYVTAVSGTSLFVDTNWNYAFETGWGTLVNGAFYSGSMGGISQYRNAPTWQNSIGLFIAGGYPLGTIATYNKRAIPDIAMLADLYTGLLVYSEGCDPCYNGGASLATPLFSGTIALINQARAMHAGVIHPIGLVAPYLYHNIYSLTQYRALNLITPPHQIISGAQVIDGGPISAFQLQDDFFSQVIGFNWDSSMTLNENQFWNDVVGVGSPNIPNFVQFMSRV